MPHTHRVSLIGLSRFERSTLESYFRLAASPLMGYALSTRLEACDLVVADADLPEAVLEVGRAGRVRDAVFIGGASAPISVGAQLGRQIDPIQVTRELGAMRRREPVAGETPGTRRAVHALASSRNVPGPNTATPSRVARRDEALDVSSSPAERRLLDDLLCRYGYGITLARGTDDAVRLCASRPHGFVFIGLGRDGLDCLQVCHQVRSLDTPGRAAPVFVALASLQGAIDRMRATFAGCDAYLTTPLNEDDVLRMLMRHDRDFERVFEPSLPLPP